MADKDEKRKSTAELDGRIYGRTPKGRIVEVRNWQYRSDSGTLIAVPLAEDQAQFVLALKEAGFSDSRIFNLLHADDEPEPQAPPPPKAAEYPRAQIRFDLDNLDQDQLIDIVEQLIGSELASLKRIDRQDIIVMIRALVEKGLLKIALE